jgi:transcriptional regulator of acetoin/glycerol metabolism
LLAHAFLRKYGGDRLAMDDDAIAALEAYGWPGNVRELQNVIERACALADGTTITRRDLPDHVLHPAAGSVRASATGTLDVPAAAADLPLRDAKERWLQVLEAAYLRDALARHGGNVSAAAQSAGIDRKTFHRLINKYRLK